MAKSVITLLSAATSTGAGTAYQMPSMFGSVPPAKFTCQAVGSVSASTGAATVAIQVSLNNTNWVTAATITLSLSTSASTDGASFDAAWAFVRANVTSISGTDAAVTVLMGL